MKINLEIDEYDTLRLLTLIRKESRQASGPWKPYWQHLAESVETALQYGQDDNCPLNETELTIVRIVDDTCDQAEKMSQGSQEPSIAPQPGA